MVKRLDLMGQKFNRLTVIGVAENSKAGKSRWVCRCDCGNTSIVTGSDLKNGHIRSCGCLKDEINSTIHTVHGMTQDPIHACWNNMKQRCQNPKASGYPLYGGRGIRVCDEWQDFQTFYGWAVSHGYEEGLTIERIDVNGNYCPENCTWIPKSEQNNNTRQNHYLTYDGRTMPLNQWAREIGITSASLRYRIRAGWDEGRIFTEGAKRNELIEYRGEKKSIKEWADEYGIAYPTLVTRLHNMSIEDALTMPVQMEHSRRKYRGGHSDSRALTP